MLTANCAIFYRKVPLPRWLWLTVLGCALGVLQCAPAGPIPQQSSPLVLSLSPSNPQIAQGTAQQFEVHGLQPDGQRLDLTNKVHITVTKEGNRLAVRPTGGLVQIGRAGQYQVTVEYGDQRAQTVLRVTTATLTSLTISPTAPQVAKGLSQAFMATAGFSDGTTQDVTGVSAWSVHDVTGSGVAVISSLGVATGHNVGQAQILVQYQGLNASTTLDVSTATLKSLSISPAKPTIAKASGEAFHARATYSDGTIHDVTTEATWTAVDLTGSGVASINSQGQVVGLAVGQTTVSAAYKGQTAQTTLTVIQAVVVALGISPTMVTVPQNSTQTFMATATMSDGTTQNVTTVGVWLEIDQVGTGVASVDNKGLAKANAVGTARIVCSYGGHMAAGTLVVTPIVKSLKVSPALPRIYKGAATQLTAAVTMTDGSVHDVTNLANWTAMDVAPAGGVVTLGPHGLAQGTTVGQATIMAQYLGVSDSTTLTVLTRPSGWLSQTIGSSPYFMGIWGDDPNNVWAVGQSAVWKWDGTLWTAQYTGGGTWNGVWGFDENNIWAVGSNGFILKWDGTTWSTQPSGSTQTLQSLWGSGTNQVWAVGTLGTILKWDGAAWSAQLSGTTVNLNGVWGTDENNIWAVGTGGTILKWDGTTWSAQLSSTTSDLYSVWGTDENNIWAVGAGGAIQKWDGTSWTARSSGTGATIYSVWGSDPNNVWAVGYYGTILKWDGTSWTSQSSGTSYQLYGVWGSSASSVWAVGAYGTVVQYVP